MALKWPDKDPDEVLDYQVDWTRRLSNGDTIMASEWILPSTTIVQDSISFSTPKTTIWLSAGTAGETNTFINRITTTGGRTMDQSVILKIKEK